MISIDFCIPLEIDHRYELVAEPVFDDKKYMLNLNFISLSIIIVSL